MKTFKERRNQKRFSVKNRSTIMVSPTTILSYEVLDISDSGLAFSYAGWENWPTRGMRLDIFDKDFFLENVPIRVIDDVRLEHEPKGLRRCGVEFTNLESNQKAILRQYIASVAAK